jgi:hypothetical protein
MPTLGSVLIAILAIAIWFWIESLIGKARKKRTSQKTAFAPHPLPMRSEPTSTTPTIDDPIPLATPITATMTLTRKDDPRDRIKDRLREQKTAGMNLASSLGRVMNEFSDRVTLLAAIQIALQIDYPPSEVATFMANRSYKPKEIAALLAEEYSFEVKELADIIMPLVKNENVAARAKTTFDIVKDSLNDPDNDDLMDLPTHLGCSTKEAADILYKSTDMRLGAILVGLELTDQPTVAADIARDIDVDLSEDEEYKSLRDDDDIDFQIAAAILKACGKDAETVIVAENRYQEFSNDQIDEIVPPLTEAGFANVEIMAGISASNIIGSNTFGTIVQGAIEADIPLEDIISFLKEEDVDLNDLDEEMRTSDVEILTRVDILHALLHPNPKTTETT